MKFRILLAVSAILLPAICASAQYTLTTLGTFNGTNGSTPMGAMAMDPYGNIYGTTESGGTDDNGTLFEIPAGSRTLTTLVNFNSDGGTIPIGDLISDSAGDIYGTTRNSGLTGAYGEVFELTAGTHDLKVLTTFSIADGAAPTGRLLLDNAGDIL